MGDILTQMVPRGSQGKACQSCAVRVLTLAGRICWAVGVLGCWAPGDFLPFRGLSHRISKSKASPLKLQLGAALTPLRSVPRDPSPPTTACDSGLRVSRQLSAETGSVLVGAASLARPPFCKWGAVHSEPQGSTGCETPLLGL